MSSALPAVILAGGRGSRMGGVDKAFLEVAGETLLARVIRRLQPQAGPLAINANGDVSRLAPYGLPILPDIVPDFSGPLAGVHAGLAWARESGAEHLVSVAVDTPFFPDDLVARLRLSGGEAPRRIVLAASGGRAHPTFGLWPVALQDEIARYLDGGGAKVLAFVERHDHATVEFPIPSADRSADPFFNINQPKDLAEAAVRLDRPAV